MMSKEYILFKNFQSNCPNTFVGKPHNSLDHVKKFFGPSVMCFCFISNQLRKQTFTQNSAKLESSFDGW